MYCKTICFIDDTLAPDNPLRFRKNIKTNHDN